MDNLTQDQISNIMDDISFLRKAISKNKLIIQQIAITRSMRRTSLFTGIAIIILSGFALIIKSSFGSFEQAPYFIKIVFLTSMILSVIVSALLKRSGILREAHQINPKISMRKIAAEIYSHRIAHVIIPLMLLAISLSILSAIRGSIDLWVPIISIGSGLGLLMYYVLLQVKEYLLVGYWHLVSGCVILMFPSIGPEYGLIISLGLGMLLLGIAPSFIKYDRATPEGK